MREVISIPVLPCTSGFQVFAGAVMAIHTFGEYLCFHPHLRALVADGLSLRGGWFHVLPESGIRPLKQLFRARTIAFLVGKGLLPPKRARMFLGWKFSGFNVLRSKHVQPNQRKGLERLAQYIIRNPFAIEKMHLDSDTGTIIYHSGMNAQPWQNSGFYYTFQYETAHQKALQGDCRIRLKSDFLLILVGILSY